MINIILIYYYCGLVVIWYVRLYRRKYYNYCSELHAI